MYCITQTNLKVGKHPSIHLRHNLDDAQAVASNMCPKAGDSATIYVCERIAVVETHTCVTMDDPADLNALFVSVQQDHDDRENARRTREGYVASTITGLMSSDDDIPADIHANDTRPGIMDGTDAAEPGEQG